MLDISDLEYSNPVLAEVITLTEACWLWGKSKKTFLYAIWRDNIDARKSLTGGNWMIATSSAVTHFGEPIRDIKVLCRDE